MTPRDHAKFHLSILGDRVLYHTTAKNYQNKQIKNEFLQKDEVISILFNWNTNGFTTWLSINDKDNDAIIGVSALQDFWIDIDARPKGIDDRPATTEEMQKALEQTIKLKNHVENEYAAIGFAANSGNGFHIHFPLPRFDIPVEMREQLNKKVRVFAKTVAKFIGVKIDNTYDISRRSTLIGTMNKKLPEPIATTWDKTLFENGLQEALKLVDKARTQNKALLDKIINTTEEKAIEQKLVPTKENHLDIEQLCRMNPKFYDLYKVANKQNELYKKYNYPSRSEAEESVLVTLVMEGFKDQEITTLMQSCSLGKWQEKPDSYHNLSLEHAKQKAGEIVKKRETENKLMEEIAGSSSETQEDDISVADINPVLVAKKIESKYFFARETGTKILYVYNETQGIYTTDTEETIKAEMCKLLGDFTKVRLYLDIENWIKFNDKTPIVEFNKEKKLLAVNNGILNLETLKLENFDPKYHITTKIPHSYKESASCKPIEDFLETSMPNQNHRLQHQEFLGKIIAKENHHFHEYGIMQGEGNNGKSVLIDIDTFFLGKNSVSNQTLQALIYDRYATIDLRDKMANFCADLPSTMLKHMGIINMIAAGDEIQSQGKYKDSFKWKPNLGMMFSCNEAPAIDPSEDHTGTYRRIMIWDFPITFTPNDPDPKHREDKTLRDRLMTEELMSGYLNYIIQGYKRLQTQGDFTAKLAVNETRKAYIKRSDSPHAFLMEKCKDTDNENDIILSDVLFRIYIDYCSANKLTRRSKGELTKAIKNYCPGAEFTKAKLNAEAKDSPRVSAWRFLKVSDLSDLSTLSVKVNNILNFENKKESSSQCVNIKTFMNRADNPDKSDRIEQPQTKKVYAERIPLQAGKHCTYPEEDHHIEAEYQFNGNLYCKDHFEVIKLEQKDLGHIICLKEPKENSSI